MLLFSGSIDNFPDFLKGYCKLLIAHMIFGQFEKRLINN